jgi:DNA-binding transcriptional LysR family regulator
VKNKSLYSNAQTFCRLVEIGNFSSVAKKLGFSQSTVSRRITQLEEDLETILIKRNTRSFEITEAGHRFYSIFINQEETLKNTVEQFRTNSRSDDAITIRLSLPMGVINGILSPKIPEYLHQNPNITLLAFYQNREVDMIKENFDLAILRHIPKHQTLLIRKLYQCQFSLYCTPEYIKNYGTPTTLDDLKDHMLLGAVHENNMVNTTVDVTLPSGEHILWQHTSRFMLNNNDPSLRIGKNHHAIIAGIDILYKEELQRGELVNVMPGYKFATFKFYLVRMNSQLNPQLEKFINFIESCFIELEATDSSSMI